MRRCKTGEVSEILRDLERMPADLRRSVRLTNNDRVVMWPRAEAAKAIEALAEAGKVVLGLDVRRYLADGTFYETAWSALGRKD